MLDLGIELLISGALYLLQSIGERMNVWMDRRSRLKQDTSVGQEEEIVSKEEETIKNLNVLTSSKTTMLRGWSKWMLNIAPRSRTWNSR